MIDERKVILHNAEIAEHANGAAQYIEALLGGRFVTREQTRDMIDYLFARTKRNIESCPLHHKKKRMQRYIVGNCY